MCGGGAGKIASGGVAWKPSKSQNWELEVRKTAKISTYSNERVAAQKAVYEPRSATQEHEQRQEKWHELYTLRLYHCSLQ